MKHGVPVILVSCCVIHVLFRQFVACDQQDVGEAIPTDTCKSVNILMASNVSTGIQVVLTSTEAGVDSSPTNLTIADHYLPPECRVHHLCNILHFGHPDGTSHYVIPSIRGFVVLYHMAIYNDNRTEEFPWNSFIGVTENCNPTNAFLARNNRILVIACMDLQSQPKGILYYMHYDILPNRTGSGWIIGRNTHLPTKPETIYNPATVSEIIHVRRQRKCHESDNLYFIDDGYALQFPTSSTSDPEFSVSDFDHPLEDCVGYQSLEHYHGSENLIVRCSNNRTALYDSCGTIHFTYAPDDNIPYPCSNWSTVAYRNGTQLTLDGKTQLLPSNDINYAKCLQGVNHPPIFIASSADGIFVSHFDGNNFTKIANGSCSADNDNRACSRPVFSENNDVFGMYDSTIGAFVIVNVTEGCTDDPIIAQIPTQSQPDLVSVSLGRGIFNCSCSSVQNTEPLTTTQTESMLHVSQTSVQNTEPFTTTQTESMLHVSQTQSTGQPDTTMATHQSESTFSSTKSSTSSALISVAGVLIAVAVVVVVIVSLMLYKCTCIQVNRVKGKKSFTPNVKCPLQESPEMQRSHKDPEDQGDKGYGSRDTSTTTSPSGSISNGSICGESECMVPFQTESDGGARHVLSKASLPFAPTQLDSEVVLEQCQSRTLDNKDREDMKNKVHTLLAEINNNNC